MMEISYTPKSGIVVPFMPFLTEKENYDLLAVEKQVNHFIESKVAGIFVLTTCGQSGNFSFQENQDLADIVLDTARGKTPVYVGIGRTKEEPDYPSKMLEHVIEKKADAAVVLCSDMSAEEQVEHFSQLNHYNFPLVAYSLGTQQKQLKKVEEILVMESVIGMKLTIDVRQAEAKEYFERVVNLGKPVFMGEDVVLYDGLELGARGGVNAIANLMPETVVALYDKHFAGNKSKAQELQQSINTVLDVIYYGNDAEGHTFDAAAALQCAMFQRFGFGSVTMRQPKPTYSEKDAEIIKSVLNFR